MDPVNLDAMSQSELLGVVENDSLPDGVREYAALKGMAMVHRLAGNIQEALRIEAKCDRIYDNLPDEWRW
jgi:hypothetical protein